MRAAEAHRYCIKSVEYGLARPNFPNGIDAQASGSTLKLRYFFWFLSLSGEKRGPGPAAKSRGDSCPTCSTKLAVNIVQVEQRSLGGVGGGLIFFGRGCWFKCLTGARFHIKFLPDHFLFLMIGLQINRSGNDIDRA